MPLPGRESAIVCVNSAKSIGFWVVVKPASRLRTRSSAYDPLIAIAPTSVPAGSVATIDYGIPASDPLSSPRTGPQPDPGAPPRQREPHALAPATPLRGSVCAILMIFDVRMFSPRCCVVSRGRGSTDGESVSAVVAVGSTTTNVHPLPTPSLRAVNEPPCAWTSDRPTASPSPSPP